MAGTDPPGAPGRAVFAGAEAGIGLVVLGLFLVLGLLGVAGATALVATGLVARDAENVGAVVVFAAAVGLWGAGVVRDLRLVRVVEVRADGAWRLRGPLGLTRAELAPGTPRELVVRERKAWILVGAPRQYTQTWAEIVTPTRRWATCRGIPGSQDRAVSLLQGWLRAQPRG